MTRIKGGILHAKHRRGILKHTRGFRWGRKSKIKLAKTAVKKSGQYAFTDRKIKKRINRGLWNIRLNAALRPLGISYSKFIGALKKKNIELNRKVLSEIAHRLPNMLEKITEAVK
ncbi:50S ribosomal protein L20 [Patescibacteria group bacterium]|nr:MAG: 50S ribosomal protein L20 [Patescibacteria group bacterium]